MIDSIGGTVVIVSDQQKAIEFYTQNLDLSLNQTYHLVIVVVMVYDGLKLHQKHPIQLLVL